MTERIDCAVIGAGVVGLAVAREMAQAGREVVVLEAADAIGTGISSRNSEVVHAGMYYPTGSLKARLCVEGNRMLRTYAARSGVALAPVGKLIVATGADEERRLAALWEQGRVNGVGGLEPLSAADAQRLEPELACTAALLSADTAILDSHALMLALLADAEAAGATLALRAPVSGGRTRDEGLELAVDGAEPMLLAARTVVVAAGLGACRLARACGLAGVPRDYLCKGNYFSLTGKMPFRRLVYPMPVKAGLGVHYTLDLAGRGRFGPDVQWIDAEDYTVDPQRADSFYAAIRRYWPGLEDGRLEPAYCGIRPKTQAPGEPAGDFLVHGPAEHGQPGVVALYGIESPGLTACLALARLVRRKLGDVEATVN